MRSTVAKKRAPIAEPDRLRGDFVRRGERTFIKLDRVGGDLFGLARALQRLSARVGDVVIVSSDFETIGAAVVTFETGAEGEFEIAPRASFSEEPRRVDVWTYRSGR